MVSTIPEMNSTTAGGLSRGIASVIPLIAEPAGQWLASASDSALVELAPLCPDDPASAWFSVLSHEVLPYQGVFLDPQSGHGWTEPRRIRRWLQSGAHSAVSTGRTDDHVITLLEYACWLLNQCRSSDPEPHLLRLRELLDDHLMRWIPALAVSLALHDEVQASDQTRFYSHVGDLLVRRLCDVRSHLGPVEMVPNALEVHSPNEGLRNLLTPIQCGVWLSRRVLASMAEELGIQPMGERFAVLQQILAHSAHRDCLQRSLSRVVEHYEGLANRLPVAAGCCASWASIARVTSSSI